MATYAYENVWVQIMFAESEADLERIHHVLEKKQNDFSTAQFERMIELINQIRLFLIHPN